MNTAAYVDESLRDSESKLLRKAEPLWMLNEDTLFRWP